MGEKTKRSDPIINRHENDVALSREFASIVVVCFASNETAAVEPHYHGSRPGFLRIVARRKYVEVKTILGQAGLGELSA